MNNHYAIFLDIDGTLMAGNEIPEENIKAIEHAKSMGHKVLINTGRSMGIIPKHVFDVPVDGIIAGLGKHIVYNGMTLRSSIVSVDILKSITDYFAKSGRRVVFEGETECLFLNFADEIGKKLKSSDEFDGIYKDIRITKVNVFEPDVTDEELNFLHRFFNTIRYDRYVETASKGYNKAKGIKIIESYLGIKHENTVAVGDSLNDADMMEYAGISIAMGNADIEIKRKADFLTIDAKDAGVAYAIENYILNGKSDEYVGRSIR